jgi:hypothetical protein
MSVLPLISGKLFENKFYYWKLFAILREPSKQTFSGMSSKWRIHITKQKPLTKVDLHMKIRMI